MRRVPRSRRRTVVEALPVMVADLRGAGTVAGPVAAGRVGAGREAAAIHGRAGEHVVLVGIIAAAVDLVAVLVERGLLVDVVVVAVQVIDIFRNRHALGVAPGAVADAVARVHALRGADADRAQIGAPGAVAGACRLSELLAVRVGAGEAAEVGTISDTLTGDEKGHVIVLLGLAGAHAERQDRRQSERTQSRYAVHGTSPFET